MLTKEDVIWCYRVFLGRDPENDQIIEQRINNINIVGELVSEILRSQEFNSLDCKNKLNETKLSEEIINWAYKLLLCEEATAADIKSELGQSNKLLDLVNRLTSKNEYKENFIDIDEISMNNERLGKALRSDNKLADKVVFLHIPKTAGSSFEKIAIKNYPAECSIVTSGKVSVDLWKKARLIGGHIPYPAYSGCDFEKLFISVVRDPVDRVLSRFNYYATLPEGPQKDNLSPAFNANDIYQTIFDSPFSNELINNYQCRFLFGESTFEGAKKVLEKEKYVLGVFEELDLWCYYLAGMLGWKNVDLPKINTASIPDYLNEYKKDKELVNRIAQRTNEDQKLYQFVKDHRVFYSTSLRGAATVISSRWQ